MPMENLSKSKNSNKKKHSSLLQTFKLIAKTKETANLISIKTFNKSDLLVEERKQVFGIFLIIEGKVKVFSTGLNKKASILRFASNGDLIGLSSLNSSFYWANAIVMEKGTAYFIDINHLHFILRNYNKLCLLMIDALSVKLRYNEIRQKHLTLFPARERIIEALLLIAYKFGETTKGGVEITIGTARKDIANYSNTSIELTIRTLSELNLKNYITIRGKIIIINEKVVLINELKQVCCENNHLPEGLNFCYPNL